MSVLGRVCRRTSLLRLGLVLISLCVASGPMRGGAEENLFEDLRRRIEQLEQDNRELRSRLFTEQRPPVRQLAFPPGGFTPTELQQEEEDDEVMELPPSPEPWSNRLDALESRLDQMSRNLELGGPLNPDAPRSTNIHPLPSTNRPPTYPNVRVTGFFQMDAGFFAQDTANIAQFGKIQNDSGFRRTRLAAVGDVAENVSYMIEMDFAFPGRPSFMDVFLDVRKVPVLGNVRMGQWRQPFGMDNLISVRELTFLERPLMFGLSPFRQTGVGFFNNNEAETMTWTGSAYGFPADAWGNAFGDKGFGTASRITMLPFYECEGRHLMHLGFDHVYEVPGNLGIDYRNTQEYGSPFGSMTSQVNPGGVAGGGQTGDLPFVYRTGPLFFDHANLFNVELAGVIDFFHWQAEGTWAVLDFDGKSVTIPSFYVRGAYVLTGEVRPYNKKVGVLGRIKPKCPVTSTGGWGAWEVAAQVSYLNANPTVPYQTAPQIPAQVGGPIIAWGGGVTNFSTVTNWYINDYTKFQVEYILTNTNRGGIDSYLNTICMRAQLDF